MQIRIRINLIFINNYRICQKIQRQFEKEIVVGPPVEAVLSTVILVYQDMFYVKWHMKV
jgi:hypothetical protein